VKHLEVTPQEEADLRSLLHAAATDLDLRAIDAPAPDALMVSRSPAEGRPRRRTIGAVAATVAAAVTVGGVLWVTGPSSDVRPLTVGPAASASTPTTAPPSVATSVTGAPRLDDWRRGTGIWRLPDPASGLRIEQALLAPTGAPPWLVGLDDAGDGQRFLAVSLLTPAPNLGSGPDPGSPGSPTTADGTGLHGTSEPATDDPTINWMTIRSDGGRGVLSITSRGVSNDDLQVYVSDLLAILGRAPGTIGARAVVDAMEAVTLPSGLTPAWGAVDPVDVLDGRLAGTALSLRLVATDGTAFHVAQDPPLVGTPAAARIAWVLTSRAQRATGADLLDGSSTLWTFDTASSQLEGFTEDGTMISVTGAADRDSSTAVLESLRATDEAAARRRLRADGIALGTVTPDVLTPTTTAPDETGHTSTTAGPSNGFDRTSTTVP